MTKIVAPAATSRRDQQKNAKRLALIDAALAVFSRVGFAAAKIDDVAEEAGDKVTEDLCIECGQIHDKFAWILQSHLA